MGKIFLAHGIEDPFLISFSIWVFGTSTLSGRFINRPTRTGGRLYDKFFVYVPTEVARDETFPFKEGEEVIIRIENHKLIVEKLEKESEVHDDSC